MCVLAGKREPTRPKERERDFIASLEPGCKNILQFDDDDDGDCDGDEKNTRRNNASECNEKRKETHCFECEWNCEDETKSHEWKRMHTTWAHTKQTQN